MFCCEKRKGGLVCRGKKLPLNSVPRLLASGGTTRLRCDFGLGVLRVSPLHTQLFLGSLEKMTDQWKEEKVDDWGIWWRLVGLKGIEIWNSETGMVQYCVYFQMIWHTSGWFLILYVFIFDYKPPTAVAGFLVSLKIKFSPTHDPKTKSSQSSHNFVIVAGYICNPRLREGGTVCFGGDITGYLKDILFWESSPHNLGELIQVDLHAFFAWVAEPTLIHTSPIFTCIWLKLLVGYVNIPVPWSILVQIYTQDSSFWISYYNSWCRISSNNISSG